MKNFIFPLDKYLSDIMFPHNRIDEREQILMCILEACRYMMVSDCLLHHTSTSIIALVIDKMKRLFICSPQKSYSVSFPFNPSIGTDGHLKFDYGGIDINSMLISQICQVLQSDEFKGNDAIDFVDYIDRIASQNCSDIWILIRHLLTYEIGYIRYDDDIRGFNIAKAHQTLDQHPRYHFDINYTNEATYKIGLTKSMTFNDFVYILNNQNDRKYLQ